jgi:putative nucleotidyltransferase with HDIG domain
MASRVGYKGDKLVDITIGALLHDIGKINTPDHLQWKQDGADPYEAQMIAEHPTFGAHWIGNLVMLTETVKRIIVEHHERFDGKGYPKALPDPAIAPESKLISVCNSYAHIATDLPDKPGLEPRDAMFAILRQSGTKFAPKIAQSFITALAPLLLDGPLYQPSALVLLDTKEVAAVMKVEHWGDTSPEIVILTDSSQKKLLRPLSISLKKDTSRKIIKIIKNG